MTDIEKKPLFELGALVATPGALKAMGEDHFLIAPVLIHRHVTGDPGELDAHDQAANAQAIREGSRVFSAYSLPNGEKVWVITEADRSVTTILLPEDY